MPRRGELVDGGRRRPRVAVSAHVIGAQRVDGDEQNVFAAPIDGEAPVGTSLLWRCWSARREREVRAARRARPPARASGVRSRKITRRLSTRDSRAAMRGAATIATSRAAAPIAEPSRARRRHRPARRARRPRAITRRRHRPSAGRGRDERRDRVAAARCGSRPLKTQRRCGRGERAPSRCAGQSRVPPAATHVGAGKARGGDRADEGRAQRQ